MYILVNKKTKKYAKFDHLTNAFIDTDDIRFAKSFDSLGHINIVLLVFRIKSKYEVHKIEITHKKINL